MATVPGLRVSESSSGLKVITPTRAVTEIAPRESNKLNKCEHFKQ